MVLVRALQSRERSETAALIRSWLPDGEEPPAPEQPHAAPPGVPLVAAQMFGGVSHNVTTRVVTR